jgi:selenocysteine lyase/cysteine desulfurase
MTDLASYLGAFSEPTGYLNFASYGPPARGVVESVSRSVTAAGEGVSAAVLHAEDDRAIAAVSRLTGFPTHQVALATSTSTGLQQIAFGVPKGEVLVSQAEFPSNLYPWWRAAEAGLLSVRTFGSSTSESASATPDAIARAIRPETVAITVSAVDFRTGYRADLAALREIIGDRLLIVDGIQGFSVVDQDWTYADALAVGGQKWLRAGWGTGFIAFSQRGLDRIRPLLGSWKGVEDFGRYDGQQHPLLDGADRFTVTAASPFTSTALATALELVELAGIEAINNLIAGQTAELIDRLDALSFTVLSPREAGARAGIVVAGTPNGQAGAALDRLTQAGVTVTAHGPDRIRFSVHATTTADTIDAAVAALQGVS